MSRNVYRNSLKKEFRTFSLLIDTNSNRSIESSSTRFSSNKSRNLKKKPIKICTIIHKKETLSNLNKRVCITENKIPTFQSSQKKLLSQIKQILSLPEIDINVLKSKCSMGISQSYPIYRSVIWKYITEIYPQEKLNAKKIINNRRQKYIKQCEILEYKIKNNNKFTENEIEIYHQIKLDVPRTMPESKFFNNNKIKNMLTRILFIWSLNNPKYSYVQGLNDLCIPFFVVYFNAYFKNITLDKVLLLTDDDLNIISNTYLKEIECDIYASFSFLLNKLKNNYINGFPGIKLMLKKLNNLIKISDYELYTHLNKQLNKYNESNMHFAFKWFYCYLIRELDIKSLILLWDSYLCTENSWDNLHIYVCKNILFNFKKEILEIKDFYDILMYLQNIPLKTFNIFKIKEIIDKALQDKIIYSDVIDAVK